MAYTTCSVPSGGKISIQNGKLNVPDRGPIQLQTHGGEIRWRNVFIKELSK